jgi:hypothetical protein
MRKAFNQEPRLDRCRVADVEFDLESRDEIVPILKALQHVCLTPSLRDAVLDRVARDVFQDVRDDVGREGMDLWHLLVPFLMLITRHAAAGLQLRLRPTGRPRHEPPHRPRCDGPG